MKTLDCRACGACCIYPWIVDVEPRDEVPEEYLKETREGCLVMAAREDGSCVAHCREDGKSTCTIYESRPATCRDFTPGSEECLVVRHKLKDLLNLDD